MDLGIIAAVVMLVVWAVGALMLDVSGSVNALLTLGTFLLLWRIVVRTTPRRDATRASTGTNDSRRGR